MSQRPARPRRRATILPPSGKMVSDAVVENLWREARLPEYFLGNGGTNHKLLEFIRLYNEPHGSTIVWRHAQDDAP
jgi:hypothetical protein